MSHHSTDLTPNFIRRKIIQYIEILLSQQIKDWAKSRGKFSAGRVKGLVRVCALPAETGTNTSGAAKASSNVGLFEDEMKSKT